MKAGDLIVSKSVVNGAIYRIGSLIPTSKGYVDTYFVAYNGAIPELNASESLRAMGLEELLNNFRLANAKEIEDAAFPESLAFVKANIEAGNLVVTEAIWDIITRIETLRSDSLKGLDQFTSSELKDMKEWNDAVNDSLDSIGCRTNHVMEYARSKPKGTCVHEPMEYVGFNSRQTICRKCDKNLD